jgi:phosphotransferase system HPr-like phosphotransfer protein
MKILSKKPQIKRKGNFTLVDAAIENKFGGGLRWIEVVCEKCQTYEKNIYFRKKISDSRYSDKKYDGKSALDILTMCGNELKPGSEIQIQVQGINKKSEEVALSLYNLITTFNTH